MNGEVRIATIGDATELARLSNQLGYAASVRDVELRARMLEASPEHRALVARLEEGAVVGWIHVYIAMRIESNPFGELGGFSMTKDQRVFDKQILIDV